MNRIRLVLLLFGVGVASLARAQAVSPFSDFVETAVRGGIEFMGRVTTEVNGKAVTKRFVLRVPAAARWNGSLVIGAHGGGGGDNYDRSGKVIGTDETALDDVVGRYSLEEGFAYASVDRDGIGGPREGLALTYRFTDIARTEVGRRMKKAPVRMYLIGLSAGGSITRLAAEEDLQIYAGTILIAGGGGDVPTRLDRIARMAALWPLVDPRVHPGLPATDPNVRAYAEAVGTPVEARRLWPYSGAGAGAAAARPQAPGENSSGVVKVPTIEVVGTWDDLIIREARAYRRRVQPQAMHRLYEVEGVWHMSGDDDGVMSFEYIAESRMKLPKDVADAMAEGPSYLPTVRAAFDHLARWVEKQAVPPDSQTVKPGAKLR
jgi:pimeloyl-ACP methyl ester carboxylesterase